MAFNNTTGVWTTDNATNLKTSAAFGAVDDISQANGTFLIGTTLDTDYTGRQVLVRIDSGSLTMVNDETIVGALQGSNQTRVGIWVNGGDLTIDGGADAANATTPFVINSNAADTTGNGPFRTTQAGIALTSGNITLGSQANPVVKFISAKSLTVDPGGSNINIGGENTGPCSLNVGTLIFENPRFNIDINDADQWCNLGFRNSSANYTVGASSFDRLIGKGVRILDVSGADAANAGMLPVNVEGSVIFVGDNGDGARFNNLVGVPFIGSASSEITWSFETNTAPAAGNSGLGNSNWFIIGDYDVIPGARRRIANQKGGAVFNKQITFNGTNSSTTQRFWLPETGLRLPTSEITDTSVEDHNSLAGAASLVPHGITPVTGAGATNDYQIGGNTGTYSLLNLPLHNSGAADTDFYRVRTGLVWNQGNGATGVNSTIVRQHNDNEYLYAGSFVNKLSAQTIDFNSTQGAIFEVQDAEDTLITDIAQANRNILADFEVTLPDLTGSSLLAPADRGVTINYTGSTATIIRPHNLLPLVKNQMMTRLTTNTPNTTVANTANDHVVDYLDAFINGGATWTITSDSAAVTIYDTDADGTYVIGTNFGTLDVTDANVEVTGVPYNYTIAPASQPTNGFMAVKVNGVLQTGFGTNGFVSTTASGSDSIVLASANYTPGDTVEVWYKPNNTTSVKYQTSTATFTFPSETGSDTIAVSTHVSAVVTEGSPLGGVTTTVSGPAAKDTNGVNHQAIGVTLTGTDEGIGADGSQTQLILLGVTNDVRYLQAMVANDLTTDFILPTGANSSSVNFQYLTFGISDGKLQKLAAVAIVGDSTVVGSEQSVTAQAAQIGVNPAGATVSDITTGFNQSVPGQNINSINNKASYITQATVLGGSVDDAYVSNTDYTDGDQ